MMNQTSAYQYHKVDYYNPMLVVKLIFLQGYPSKEKENAMRIHTFDAIVQKVVEERCILARQSLENVLCKEASDNSTHRCNLC